MIQHEDNERESREVSRECNRELRDTAIVIGIALLLAVVGFVLSGELTRMIQ